MVDGQKIAKNYMQDTFLFAVFTLTKTVGGF